MRRAEDGMGIVKAVRAHLYRTELSKESRKSWEPSTQRDFHTHRRVGHVSRTRGQTATATDPHETQERTMSPNTRSTKKHAKAQHRRRRTAQERLAHERPQAQQ